MKIPSRLSLLLLMVIVSAGCGQREPDASSLKKAADLVFINGRVYTVNPEQAWAEAVAVRGGKILGVGSGEQMSAYRGENTQVIDLAGKLLMPGLVDAHVHPAWGGVKDLFQCNFPFSAGPEEIAATIARCVENQPESEWIIGGQWTSNFFVDHKLGSPAKWLDKVSGDKAVVLTDDTGHNHWANSRALELMGIDASTADPEGGKILRDPTTGEANGVLEELSGLVKRATPEWTLRQYTAGAAYSVEQANKFGVTGMKDASASAVEVQAFYALDQERKLTVHLASSLFAETRDSLNALDFDEFVRLREKYQSEHLHTNFVKIFLDGVPTASRSAAMLAPYTAAHEDEDAVYGEMHLQPEALATAVAQLDELGFTVKIHAAGDRSVRAALDAIEHARQTNGRSGLRHELAHGGYIDPSDIPRFAALNAVADFSPHIWFPSPIMDSVIGALGERGQYYWPTRDLIDSQARLLIGSDWPSAVPDMNPWRGLEALVTRRDPVGSHPGELWPEQAVSLEEAVEIFTLGGANALKLEAVTGSITVGKSADLIVLWNNLFDIPVEQISDIQVSMTFFEGELVYSVGP
jgi:predicted amidohydrolase YtcJ